MKKLLYIILFIPLLSNATTYYVSNSGADGNNGTSTGTPWQTISKVNGFSFTSGDIIQFNGGQTFSGAIVLAQSVTVQSYGTGQATISSGTSAGYTATNIGGITINNLIFTGSGISSNTVDGIHIENNQAGNTKLQNVTVSGVTVSGYGGNGIFISGNNGTSGFNNVNVLNSIAHDCTGGVTPGIGTAGIKISSDPGYTHGIIAPSHTNVLIDHCTAYNNTGKAGDSNWTGSGIFLAETGNGTIQYSTAYNNGANSNNGGGGPVGIWVFDGHDYLMQYNESHHNLTGAGTPDGDGFDVDGGCTNTIVQYNYSHDNYGAGFQIYTFTDSGISGISNVDMQYNISQNDVTGGNGSYGSIMIGSDGNSLTGINVYNNTLYNTIGPTFVFSGSVGGLTGGFYNNILVSSQQIKTNTNNPASFNVNGNDYPGTFNIEWNGTTYTSLSTWQTATSKEKISGSSVAKTADPVFMSPGNGSMGYKLSPTSTIIGQGLNLVSLYGLTVGSTDYYGYPILSPYGIGANQYTILKVLGRIVLH